MSEVKWRRRALADAERLHRFLREKDPRAAERGAELILKGLQALRSLPLLGRPLPDGTGRRELFMGFGSGGYVLTYRVDAEKNVVVLCIHHDRENRSH